MCGQCALYMNDSTSLSNMQAFNVLFSHSSVAIEVQYSILFMLAYIMHNYLCSAPLKVPHFNQFLSLILLHPLSHLSLGHKMCSSHLSCGIILFSSLTVFQSPTLSAPLHPFFIATPRTVMCIKQMLFNHCAAVAVKN